MIVNTSPAGSMFLRPSRPENYLANLMNKTREQSKSMTVEEKAARFDQLCQQADDWENQIRSKYPLGATELIDMVVSFHNNDCKIKLMIPNFVQPIKECNRGNIL